MGTPPAKQYQYYDNQDTFDPDIDALYAEFITPLDQIRSHFNALSPGSTTISPTFQESRCHAYFRMLGLPVASTSGYYSPGHDPNLNLDSDAQTSVMQISNSLTSNSDFKKSQTIRETQTFLVYDNAFSAGGVNATAVCIGAQHLRAFDKQFTDGLDPLSFDSAQIQTVQSRVDDVKAFFTANNAQGTWTSQYPNIQQSLLQSTHIIKPFVVDPRIDTNIKPNVNRIAAPFLLDRSQLKIFTGGDTPVMLKRPYIEFVLSTILNNTNEQQLSSAAYVKSIVNAINASGTTNTDLITTVSSSQLTQTSISVFARYLKIIRSLVTMLYQSIVALEAIRDNINYQPTPNPTQGPEAGANGATIPDPTPGDPNNLQIESSIIAAQANQILSELQLNVGTNGIPDPGDFAFSGVDDLVFDAKKAAKTSYVDIIQDLKARRTKVGLNGMNALKNIEIIVGDFSGLGLLDIMAIQASMWIVSPAVLASMIDTRAFARMKQRQDLSVNISQSSDIIGSLKSFETVVVQMYKQIQGYIDALNKTNGQYTDIQPQ